MQSLIKKFAGQEREILTRHEAIGLMDTMDFYNIRCYNSYFNLINHCKEVAGNGRKGSDDRGYKEKYERLYKAVVLAVRNSALDMGEGVVRELEVLVVDWEERYQKLKERNDLLEARMNGKYRFKQKDGIEILGGCEI